GNLQSLLGRKGTILILGRTDHSKEWLGTRAGITLPVKKPVSSRLITETEIALVKKIASLSQATDVRFFVPYPGTRGIDEYWKDFVKTILVDLEHQ
ncbi:MAG TPA: hypothetical protein VFA38_00410, partial [Nitrospirales bacterium]|nr:hypothetical protein [Nitrospirales bacterium]